MLYTNCIKKRLDSIENGYRFVGIWEHQWWSAMRVVVKCQKRRRKYVMTAHEHNFR